MRKLRLLFLLAAAFAAGASDFDVLLHGLPPGSLQLSTGEDGALRIENAAMSGALWSGGVREGDLLVQVDGVDRPAMPLGDWVESALDFGQAETDTKGFFPLVGVAGDEDAPDFVVKGFLKVEVVSITDAEVKFRPVGEHLDALKREREDSERQRSLELEKKAEDERRRAAELELEQQRQRQAAEDAARAEEERELTRKKEAEAAAARAAKSKLNVEEMRAAGVEFAYTAEFAAVGPMGITFDLSIKAKDSGAFVASVAQGSAAQSLGIREGDQLIAVNDVDTQAVPPDVATRSIMASDWPRVLVFRVPGASKPKEARSLVLTIHEPTILIGEHELRTPIEWGWNRPETGPACSPLSLVATVPATACVGGGSASTTDVSFSHDLNLLQEKSQVGGKAALVVAKRGTCAFVEKARAVQEQLQARLEGESTDTELAKSAIIIVNSEDEFIDMPAGNLDVGDIQISVFMALSSLGKQLESVIGLGIPIKASLAPLGSCEAPPLPTLPPEVKQGGGLLLLLASAGELSVPYQPAPFSLNDLPSGSFEAMLADPADGCDATAFQNRVAGKFLIAERGGCSFGLKALAAQQGGARGLIVVNSDDSVFDIQATEEELKQIRIPVVMGPRGVWEWSSHLELVARRSLDFVGRLIHADPMANEGGKGD